MVSEETIVNCWNKINILNCIIDEEINNFMQIDMSDIMTAIDAKIMILNLSKFEYKSSSNAQTFLTFIDSIESETSEDLSDQAIYNIVNNIDETVNDENEQVNDADEPVDIPFNLVDAKNYADRIFSFFEQKELFGKKAT